MNIDRGSFCFSLFGIPIAISPFSWVILAIFGGGLNVSSAGDLRGILVFVAVGMITLIIHELGHALVGRALGGIPYGIVVRGFGATTYSRPPAGKWPFFLMVLAGPLATLLPAIVAGLLFGIQVLGNPLSGLALTFVVALGITPPDFLLSALGEAGEISPFVLNLYFTTFTVSVWWALFNLLPILPMDGGQLLDTLCPHHRIVCGVGLVLATLIAIWALCHGYFFLLILFGYFAHINYKLMK